MKQNRREFLTTIAAAGAAFPMTSALNVINSSPQSPKYPVRFFSKPLDSYDFDFMCECLVRSGIDGFDMTVRRGGKIEPSKVEKDLPELVKKAGKYNLAFDMMVTEILTASDPFTERVLRTASSSGIKYYRLGWYAYDYKNGIRESIQSSHTELQKIIELNKKYKIRGDYQNHAGLRVGGPVWDIDELLRDLPADLLGIQYDVRHATVEGANSWILGMKLMGSKIRSLAIKDFTWEAVKDKPEAVTVPLGEGIVNWDLYFTTLKELKIEGPITLHIEYPLLEKGEEKLSLSSQQDIIVRKMKKDMSFINSYLDKYQLG